MSTGFFRTEVPDVIVLAGKILRLDMILETGQVGPAIHAAEISSPAANRSGATAQPSSGGIARPGSNVIRGRDLDELPFDSNGNKGGTERRRAHGHGSLAFAWSGDSKHVDWPGRLGRWLVLHAPTHHSAPYELTWRY